ncbi:anti-sigma factor domain-containing protein [Hydrocarboniphaga sp.]|uniref:anti-sigma factor domain-containing protein n=1 Tax=Hydrocarboniphaga sp. TaxID=2033016 RepID=UPI003D114076
MNKKPSNPEFDAMRDDEVLSWLTQDRRNSLDWNSLDDEQREAEAAAAMYALGSLGEFEKMPDDVAARLIASIPATAAATPPAAAVAAPKRGWWHSIGLAWGSASFASLVAVALALRLVSLPPPPIPGQIALASPAHYSLQPGPDAAGQAVKGEVVWDPSKSGGYVKLSGLPINDPNREQYQLWIFDGKRDQRYPVDGGVFNVTKNGEVELWIRVPIPVREAAMFAVTVEQSGGTVVSDRGRIVALAKTGA